MRGTLLCHLVWPSLYHRIGKKPSYTSQTYKCCLKYFSHWSIPNVCYKQQKAWLRVGIWKVNLLVEKHLDETMKTKQCSHSQGNQKLPFCCQKKTPFKPQAWEQDTNSALRGFFCPLWEYTFTVHHAHNSHRTRGRNSRLEVRSVGFMGVHCNINIHTIYSYKIHTFG